MAVCVVGVYGVWRSIALIFWRELVKEVFQNEDGISSKLKKKTITDL